MIKDNALYRHLRIAIFMLVAIAVLAAASWLLVPRIQTMRADAMLGESNRHVESANSLMAQAEATSLMSQNLTSQDNINHAREAVEAALPLFAEASAEVDSARQGAESASGLVLLPEWYREYLEIKAETAGLRGQQLKLLDEISRELIKLYEVGPLVFQSLADMDRLLGQLSSSSALINDNPEAAGVTLVQTATSMRAIQQQLDSRYQETGFSLLSQLAADVGDNAELAELSAALAAAVSGGDQAQAQEAAKQLQDALLTTSIGVNYLEAWLSQNIDPLKEEYLQLQLEQEDRDHQAAAAYGVR